MAKPVKIIDLFSGPGGLGEGFSTVKDNKGNPVYKIVVSIEKEKSAHSTLLLRAFYRQFGAQVPEEYYDFLKGTLGKTPDEQLYPLFNDQYQAAKKEALCLTLGEHETEVKEAITEAIGVDECILIGGPPCQAYSLAGRSRNMGIKDYDAKLDHRNFLYLEYLKVIAEFQPMFFVMENVKGMLSAKIESKPIFESIYNDLKSPCSVTNIEPTSGRKNNNYKIFSLVTENPAVDDIARDPRDFIIRAENHNIPQKRHRVILLGIREDIANKWNDSLLLQKSNRKVTVGEALSGLPELRSGLSKEENTDKNWVTAVKTAQSKVIPALNKSKNQDHHQVAARMESTLSKLQKFDNGQGKSFGLKASTIATGNSDLNNWYKDSKLDNRICNNETRGHITKDLNRYLFCSAWAQVAEDQEWEVKTPKSKDYIKELMPNHANFSSGKFADRFRVQASNSPATTITSHISKDGHYYIHPDPKQCRSLTVREAARIQTFPDNYFFVGTRTQQYVQVGNAVPPYLAKQIAEKLCKLLK